MSFRWTLLSLLDECLSDQLRLESDVLSSPARGATRELQAERLGEILTAQFEGIDRLIGDDAALYREAAQLLRQHPIHRDIFLQSAIVTQRRSDAAGGLFGFGFQRFVFERPELGYSPYAELLDTALLDLPLCRAMRTLAGGLSRKIAALPSGAKVLGVGSGPATEFLSLPPAQRQALDIEIQDSDPLALDHVARQMGETPLRLARMDHPADIVGSGRYDLILAPHLLAQLPSLSGGPHDAALHCVAALAGRLNPGGLLVLAAPLPFGGSNPYRRSHRMLIGAENGSSASHRSQAELVDLSSGLGVDAFSIGLACEDTESPIGDDSVFGVLTLRAKRR